MSKIFYCICEDDCRTETMSKEQILAAITQAIQTGSIGDVDTGFVTTIKEKNAGKGLTFWVGTNAQYNKLTETEDGCLYIITDEQTASDLARWVEANFVKKGEYGMVQEFDSGSITANEYTYEGDKSQLYTVLVHIANASGGTTMVIDRANLTTTAQFFYGNLSADHFAVKAWLDENGYPHFAIDATMYSTYKLRRICGYC